MYYLRIAGVNFPVAPQSLNTEIANKNRAISLVNEDEVNIPKKPGLTSYSLDIRLPDEEYPWAYWEQPSGSEISSGYNDPDTYIQFLMKLKSEKSNFDLLLAKGEDGGNFTRNVTLETMSVAEATDGVVVNCTFKDFEDFATVIKKSGNTSTTKKTTLKPKKSSYTVASGDTLKGISKKMYGTQNYSSKIYSWNKSAIEKAAKNHGKKSSSSGKYIYKGTKLTLKTITK